MLATKSRLRCRSCIVGALNKRNGHKGSFGKRTSHIDGVYFRHTDRLLLRLYMLDGLYQSVICYYTVYLMFQPGNFLAEIGSPVDNPNSFGIFVAFAAVITVNFYILMNTYRWDWATLLVVGISLILAFGWTGIYTSFTSSYSFYGAAAQVMGTLSFWSQTLLTVVICLAPRFLIKSYQKVYMPRDVDVVREQVTQGKFRYLDEVDPSSPGAILDKIEHTPSSSSTGTDPKANGYSARPVSKGDSERPMYPPSITNTTTTRNPHSQQGSDDSTTPQPFVNRASFDKPRISLDRPRTPMDRPRPSYDRCRSSMDALRPSFEASGDMTTASYLSKVESSKNNAREPSRLRE